MDILSLNVFLPVKLIFELEGFLEQFRFYKSNEEKENFTDISIAAVALSVKCKV
jgi:hypothetical protein